MKFCCILLSFAIVEVLAAPQFEGYIKQLMITSKYIKLTENFSYPKDARIADSDECDTFPSVLYNAIKNLIHGDTSMELANTKNLQQRIDGQIVLRNEIGKETKLPVPVVKTRDVPVPKNKDEGLKVISKLENELRSKTGEAILDLFEYAIDNKESDHTAFSCYSKICRVAGLAKSIKNPSLYIIKAEYEDEYCWLTAVDKSVETINLDCIDVKNSILA
ncbi:uncharacterized protein LOC126835429 isoform X2 [Adelges cooleyi]|uniref:uncharacterized protein LOC126835429 isoform X2 n=1 Tax=Adelges cooleyi TaxID=133065 RepID=UPI00217F5C6A|nr:uncharacterized protein LOC126835429 isoform X2 [Adelges cooleyi]